MASHLFVLVLRADVSSSSNTSLRNFSVKLRFNGQNCTTSIKETVPRWDERFCFLMRPQADPSGDPTLRAEVYSSGSLLGTILLSDAYFDRHSDNVSVIIRPWNGTNPVAPHDNGGVLHLKVFLATADDLQHDILETVFATNDQYAEENIVDQHPSIVLRPDDVSLKEISPNFEPGRIVEKMQHLFVRVVKARKLPDVDANGSLDPYVEVKFGAYNKGVTKCLKRNKNPEWNETFAFPFENGKAPSARVDLEVYDKDLVKDDFVGRLRFDVKKIQERSHDDIPLEPTWYLLHDRGGKTLAPASLLVAIWIGSQADEAYRHAGVSRFIPKVYENPRLWCLRITIFEAQGITVAGDNAGTTEVYCKACLGNQFKKTRTEKKQMLSSGTYTWNEDLVLVAAEPFYEGDLMISLIASRGKDEIIGQLTLPLASIDKCTDDDHQVTSHWFDLENPTFRKLQGDGDDSSDYTHMKICLRNMLDGRYHIGPDLQDYIDDILPADRKLWSPRIGSLDLGILRAINLTGTNDGNGITALNPYCVAKYGDRWVRTRTVIDGPVYVFNEQYTWDVHDVSTVLNVAVFDHCTEKDSRHRLIGKVRIHLSCLETNRTYAHSYPLVILQSSGAIKTGELQLSVKISSASSMNMLRRYAHPILPRMHYVEPFTYTEEDFFGERDTNKFELCWQAAKVLALRLGQMEHPLRSEVVACMCNAEGSSLLFSMRKLKVNFHRVTAAVIPFDFWTDGVGGWRNYVVALLAQAIFILAVWVPKLLVPLVALYVASVAFRNYQRRPTRPPHVDYDLCFLGTAHPDELDEEFDTAESRCGDAMVLRMRYDRLRSVGGRIQIVMGDIASHGEKIHSLVNWNDPRATLIFEFFMLAAAAVAYFVPFQILVTAAGLSFMMHSRFRARSQSIILNFFYRLPSRRGDLL